MNTETLQALLAESDIRSGTRPDVLATIVQPGASLCLWDRAPQPDVSAFLAALVKCGAPLALDFIVEAGASVKVAPVVTARFSTQLADPALHALLDDLDRLIAIFRSLSGGTAVRVRFMRVVDAACALFHVDTLSVRLLCTYHGAGAQWVAKAHSQRKQLGLRGRNLRKANAAIVPDPAHIRTMPEWQVGVFKGRAFPGDPHSALIHRSHPQCCADHARIRLVLDLADAV